MYTFYDIFYLIIIFYLIFKISFSDIFEADDKWVASLKKQKQIEYRQKVINYQKYQQKRNRNFRERKKKK